MITPTAYLEIHTVSANIVISDFFDEGVRENNNHFQRDLEQKIAGLIAHELNQRDTEVMVDSEWYEHEHPCRKEISNYPDGTRICDEPTALRKGTPAGTYRRCGYGHEQRGD